MGSTPQNTQDSGPERDEQGRFLPGQSGNPGGRPRTPASVRESFRECTELALTTLKQVMQDVEAPPSSRVKAAEVTLAYGWGRPTQPFEISGPEGGPVKTEAVSREVDPEHVIKVARVLADAGVSLAGDGDGDD